MQQGSNCEWSQYDRMIRRNDERMLTRDRRF